MPVNPLLDDLFTYVGIQSPFLIWCFYPILKRLAKLATPLPVFLAVSGTCIFFYLTRASNIHFLYAAGFILISYSLLAFKLRYSKLDALVLSVLTLIAIDQMWQIPYYIFNWPTNLLQFEAGISHAAWNLMSLPFIFYFVLKAKGKIRLNSFTNIAFWTALWFTLFDAIAFDGDPILLVTTTYYLVLPWFIFFLGVFYASRGGEIRP